MLHGKIFIRMKTNEMNRRSSCTFTGHRESKLPWRDREDDPRCIALKRCIADAVEAVYRDGATHFICGMATGCDMYFCEAVLALREEHPEVTLEAAIPCEDQAGRWSAALRRRWERLVTECDCQTVISKEYTDDCMMRRNRYMVDASAYLIAAYNGAPGGTRSTLLYAMRQGVHVIQLPIKE